MYDSTDTKPRISKYVMDTAIKKNLVKREIQKMIKTPGEKSSVNRMMHNIVKSGNTPPFHANQACINDTKK